MQPYRIKTISEFHKYRGLPKPEHPLISVINFETVQHINKIQTTSIVIDFYLIVMKRHFKAIGRYGQKPFDFDEGIMGFMSPGPVFSLEVANEPLPKGGWVLLIHPDFLWNTPLAKTIKQYEYFDYSVNEALYLSDKEESMIANILSYIEQEYHANIDRFSQSVIIAQLELLLTYADRFYNRQFLTRKIDNHAILDRLENILTEYFDSDALKKGLPTVQYVASKLNVSPNYLSTMLKILTGQSTQQHIHDKLIDKAKEKLSTTDLSISEISYQLGFEHLQSFSKLFKTKTNISPLEFRRSFD